MASGLIAKKLSMTSLFKEDGRNVPVTILKAGPNYVVQVKTKEKDHYDAVQLGFEPTRMKLLTKAERGHQQGFQQPFRVLREFRQAGDYKVSQELNVGIFQPGQRVKVTGISKGKGFQGSMKRHGFGGGRASHGSGFHRSPGSMGASAYPSRIFKGKKLPGRMGNQNVSTHNLLIAAVDREEGLLFLQGAVPGPRQSYVKVEMEAVER